MKIKTNGAMHTILGKKIDYKNFVASKQITKVMYEKNYSKFTLFDNNRDINETHVEELIASMRKSGQLMPVVVTPDKEVIDGQHRLKACEKLGIPVSYVISPIKHHTLLFCFFNFIAWATPIAIGIIPPTIEDE